MENLNDVSAVLLNYLDRPFLLNCLSIDMDGYIIRMTITGNRSLLQILDSEIQGIKFLSDLMLE